MPLHDKCEQADNRALSLLTIEDSVNSESAVTLLGTETGTMETSPMQREYLVLYQLTNARFLHYFPAVSTLTSAMTELEVCWYHQYM